MDRKNTLAPEDWIKAAFRALGQGGPQAIRVEAIARDLSVSKGSFYWHFKDARALKRAMLEHWQRVATFEAIAKVEHGADEGRAQLAALIELATGGQSADYGGPKIEAAIRDWGRADPGVARIVEKVEATRLDFVAGLLCKAGADKGGCQQRARLLYGAMIGLEQLPGISRECIRTDLNWLVRRLLGEAPAGQANG